MMAAMRATPSTSPFWRCRYAPAASVAGCITMRPWAMAVRCGGGLGPHVHHVGLALGIEMGRAERHRVGTGSAWAAPKNEPSGEDRAS